MARGGVPAGHVGTHAVLVCARASGRPRGLCSALVSPEKPEEGEASTTEAAWEDHGPRSAPGRQGLMREPAQGGPVTQERPHTPFNRQ